MPDYDLSRLSSRSFEHLIQSLAIRLLGPDIVVFGDGPDGGREATFEGKVPFPKPANSWDGYGVVQAKYRQRLGDTKQDGNWAVDQLKDEIRKYTDPDRNLRKPDYFIFATNVVLTSVSKKGSKDRVMAVLEDFKKQSPLKGYAVWDYDQIRGFLDTDKDVREANEFLITPGDVLSRILRQIAPTSTDRYPLFVEFLEKELLNDEFVNLEQAGHGVEERIPLATVFVDLPTHDEPPGVRAEPLDDADIDIDDKGVSMGSGEGFIKEILATSSEHLDPASLGTSAISQSLDAGLSRESRGRFVLIGGPGQGKTTLTQFICQIFRASIISQKPPQTLSPEIREALRIIQDQSEIEGFNLKVVPRFPFKIVLSDFAKALSSSEPTQVNSVFSYLTRQMKKRTATDLPADEFRQFLSLHPSVIIFDGLDEVPASSNRDQVLDAIRDFWIETHNLNADILAIATSRPQGYNEDFSPLYYRHRKLAELSDQHGWHFAKRLAEMRYRTDEDRKQKVLGRLKRTFHDESTTRLMRSPLQVTIMTALVDRIGQPPQAQWRLFDSYYEVIYLREEERNISASTILRDYRPDIRAIHNQVGLILQIDSERTGRTDAKLSRDRFVSLVRARLKAEGHTGEKLHKLAQDIVDAASQRLVFLVEVESEQIGFEIRSLQEFMAAESLMDGIDQIIRERLNGIASIPFWRNVFLFAAGKCFAERQELREAVHATCASLNETDGDELAGTYLAGSDLAIALLEEGSARRQPKFENLLARIAIRALDTANPSLQIELADIYESRLQDIFEKEIKLRLTGGLKISSIGAWNCLLRLVARDIPWAVPLAEQNWPRDEQEQIDILHAIDEPTKNIWAVEKLLQLIPSTSVFTLASFTELADRRGLPEDRVLEPQQEAAVSVLELTRGHIESAVNVLNTNLSHCSLVRLSRSDYPSADRLRHFENWHPSWRVYKYAGDFLEAPSKESLDSTLSLIADYIYAEGDVQTNLKQWNLPWPILACVNSCNSSIDLLKLAERAAQGELGDIGDWISAETRWFENGITRDDLVSMSDDRLPFDAKIGESGFPTDLDMSSVLISSQEAEGTLKDVLDVFGEIGSNKTRSFVAKTINWLIYSFASRDEASRLSDLNLQTLRSVYREVPSGSPVPLYSILHLIGESIRDVDEFFTSIEDKNFLFRTTRFGRDLPMENVGVLRRAYMGLNEGSGTLLSALGVVAERGQLSGQHVDIVVPMSQLKQPEKMAAFIIMLSQETWDTDNCEQLIESAQEIGDLSSNDFNRIVTTLETNRPNGNFVEKFVIALRELVPLEDYLAHKRYVSLLGDIIRKRTSRFSDSNNSSQFALPEGVVGLLRE